MDDLNLRQTVAAFLEVVLPAGSSPVLRGLVFLDLEEPVHHLLVPGGQVYLVAAYDAHTTVISRIVHGKTHLAVTTQAEPLPNTDTVDARQARRAAQQRDDALAQAREAVAREENARKGSEAADLALKERGARERAETPAPAATEEAVGVQNPPPPSAIPALDVSCNAISATSHAASTSLNSMTKSSSAAKWRCLSEMVSSLRGTNTGPGHLRVLQRG